MVQPAPRASLPFGAVMAAGAASQLSAPAGLGVLEVPLLAITIGLAVAIAVSWVVSRRGRDDSLGGGFGELTVPIGLAVIGGGLARLGGPVALVSAAVAVVLAWASTALLAFLVLAGLRRSATGLVEVGGAWFLAPAVLAADSLGTVALGAHRPGLEPALGWAAALAAVASGFAYLVVVALVVLRIRAHRLEGVAAASWWIAAGCGGLCAAALGRSAASLPTGGGAAGTLHLAALVCWCLGSVAAVPVLVGSARYLVGLRRLSGSPPWPPTFSTGVYALGTAEVGHIFALAPLVTLAGVAAVATLGFWGTTVLAFSPRLARR